MDKPQLPEVVREKTSRLTGGHLSCALVFQREFTREEVALFHCQPADGEPRPDQFNFDGRVVRYDCPAEDEAKWRLAFEIFFVKTFRGLARESLSDTGIRKRAGLRKLHVG